MEIELGGGLLGVDHERLDQLGRVGEHHAAGDRPRVARELDGGDQLVVELGIVSLDEDRQVVVADADAQRFEDPGQNNPSRQAEAAEQKYDPERRGEVEAPVGEEGDGAEGEER